MCVNNPGIWLDACGLSSGYEIPAMTDGREPRIAEKCKHLAQIQDVTPSAEGCEDCLEIGDTWVHLRLCKICGHVGCCDNSKNQHARKHFLSTEHAIIESFEPGEKWGYCYIDDIGFRSLPEV